MISRLRDTAYPAVRHLNAHKRDIADMERPANMQDSKSPIRKRGQAAATLRIPLGASVADAGLIHDAEPRDDTKRPTTKVPPRKAEPDVDVKADVSAAPPPRSADPVRAAVVPSLSSLAGTPIDPRSLLFDADWYRSEYPDVAAAGTDPVTHFFANGAREGRNPNRYFVTSLYLEKYPDIALAEMNPFLHYLLYGAREGRQSGR